MLQVLSDCHISVGKLQTSGILGRKGKIVLSELFGVCSRENKVNRYCISDKL